MIAINFILLSSTPILKQYANFNHWLEIAIPSPYLSKFNKYFKYSNILEDNNSCINRTEYQIELVRLVGYNPTLISEKKPVILVVGSQTSVGSAIIRKFERKNVSFVAIKGVNDIDFSSLDAFKLLDPFIISGALIVHGPALLNHADVSSLDYQFDKNAAYFKNIFSYLHNRSISYVFSHHNIPYSDLVGFALQNGGCIVEYPLIIDSIEQNDLENPLMRVARECQMVHSSKIHIRPSERLHSITSDLISKFIRKQLKEKKKGRFSVVGHNNMSIQDSLRIVAGKNCNLSIQDSLNDYESLPLSENYAIIGNDKPASEMVRDAFSSFQNLFDSSPYLSIVITGRHDNFSRGFEVRAQNFLDSIANAFQKVPLASFEIVFVDYATPFGTTPLSQIFTIQNNLKKRVRFISVPVDTHKHIIEKLNSTISFLEYIAKNIGIRRSKGRFILTTNPDSILSTEFFEIVSQKVFNPGVLYRAVRWDLEEYSNHTVNEIARALNNPWDLGKLKINKRCGYDSKSFAIIDSKEAFDTHSSLCASGDFLLLSKELWDSSGGFPEYPANPHVDAVFNSKMMRFIPGYARKILDQIILHQYHPRKNVFRPGIPNHVDVMNEYCCFGHSRKLSTFADYPDWGLNNHTFNELRL